MSPSFNRSLMSATSGTTLPVDVVAASVEGTSSSTTALQTKAEETCSSTTALEMKAASKSSSLEKVSTGVFWSDVSRAIHACNRGWKKDSLFVSWKEVKDYLHSVKAEYKDWSSSQIRNKYKYLKQLRKQV